MIALTPLREREVQYRLLLSQEREVHAYSAGFAFVKPMGCGAVLYSACNACGSTASVLLVNDDYGDMEH